ncbi:coiled-coil domain-containing protein 174-like [Pollicipes pollicipes]|uniref:coiled-coil domain-containing protein 174-like n=1 Tax=Pollicipes pollicipes TaxID=41117 RepID=UPI001884C8BB|nr:coiled-coil domain-containing protein 174-like [Pollicipes pollicipes]
MDEARAHGAGYFAFSQDAAERARQQAQLDELRQQTEAQKSTADQAKKRKNKQLKDRLRKMRWKGNSQQMKTKRQLRWLLPPVPTQEELDKKAEQDRREEERQKFIREWDLGKEGVSKRPLLTQEQWVEQQRQDRRPEFAPPTQYEPGRRGRGRQGPTAAAATATSAAIPELPRRLEDGGCRTVAPPATAEYFGGGGRGRRGRPPAPADIGDAIEAGLALLSDDTEKKHSKTFDL